MLTFTQAIQEVGKRAPLDHGAPITPIKGSPLPESSNRVRDALTGDPVVDGAMSGPITSIAILNPVIDRTYDTPYGAGGSVPLEDPTVYIDVHVPRTITVPRLSKPELSVTFDPVEPYCIHENLEQRVMEWLIAAGWEDEPAYRVAHYCFAEVAEAAWYRAHDIDQSKAEAEEDVWLEQIQHENPARPPPNLYVTPYPHRDVGAAASEPFVEQIPSDDEVRRGREVVAAALGIIDPTPDRVKIVKAAPMYVRRQLLNGEALASWAKDSGFETTLDPIDMHVTVAYSREPMDWPSEQPDGGMTVEDGKRSIKRFGEGAVVLAFEAPPLSARWKEFRDLGASWDWPEYQPHVTISYNSGEMDDSKVMPYSGPLEFGPEIFEPVKEDWKDSITEKAMGIDPRVMEYLSKIDPRVMGYLTKEMPDLAAVLAKMSEFDHTAMVLAKLQPGVADVHVASASGGKRKSFKDIIGGLKKPKDEAEVVAEKGWSIPLKVKKVDDEQMKVFGWASVTQIGDQIVIDKQGDIILEDELEKAAHEYVLYCRDQGEMHEKMGVGRLIQSFVFTKQMADCGFFACDMQTEEQMFGWAVAFKVDSPEVWAKIRDNTYGEFSIGGKAVRVPVDA